jgi:hypothetical protein
VFPLFWAISLVYKPDVIVYPQPDTTLCCGARILAAGDGYRLAIASPVVHPAYSSTRISSNPYYNPSSTPRSFGSVTAQRGVVRFVWNGWNVGEIRAAIQ